MTEALKNLKQLDQEAYISCLYLPDELREHAICLYTFHAEIERIPHLVSEPLPGEIRLQFWRDFLVTGKGDGGGPLAEQLHKSVSEKKLPKEVLYNKLDAHIFDLYQDQMPDMGSFEGYCGETVSSMLQLVALSAGIEQGEQLAQICGHAGMAIGIYRLIGKLPYHMNRGQIFFPKEVLEQYGLSREQWLDNKPDEAHKQVLKHMISLAREHQALAKKEIKQLPKQQRILFLPLAFVEAGLKKQERNIDACFKEGVSLSSLKRQWTALKWGVLG